MYWLVTSDFNWADEMDLQGFAVISDSEKVMLQAAMEEYEEEIEFWIGTNEEVHFDNGLDMLSCLVFKEITEEQAKMMFELFDEVVDDDDLLIEYLFDLAPDSDEDSIIVYVESLEPESDTYKNLLTKAKEYHSKEGTTYNFSYGFDLVSQFNELSE